MLAQRIRKRPNRFAPDQLVHVRTGQADRRITKRHHAICRGMEARSGFETRGRGS